MKQKTPTFREPGRPIDSSWGKCLLFIVYSFYTCLSRLSIAKKPVGEARVAEFHPDLQIHIDKPSLFFNRSG
jgi:hypothetical protein